jgi:carbon monoxide dehydrogenase subunit G
MRVEKKFTVSANPDTVWVFLTDPHKVAGCLPGAAITGQTDDRSYTGTITVKVGPVATSYRGQVRFERLDPATRTAEIVASGQDVKGKGGADMKMTSRIVDLGGGQSEVTVEQEISVTGILAQMGRGMINDVGDQMFDRFTTAMRAQLAATAPVADPAGAVLSDAPASTSPGPPAPAPEPIQALSLGAGVAGRALGRTIRQPGFWIVVIGLVLLVWWLLR